MKIAAILGLILIASAALADKKIELEDIERDNLRAESKAGRESTEEVSPYDPAKSTNSKPNYQPNPYENEKATSGYEAIQRSQDKYVARPFDYKPDVKYLSNSVEYEKDPESLRYSDYHQQMENPSSNTHPRVSSYETVRQQFFYQPEVPADNHYDTVQHRTPDKFVKNSKESLYVNVPMTQLLAYYPNIALDQSVLPKTHPLIHGINGQPEHELAIPIYTGGPNRDAVYSNSKITYQIRPQYTSQATGYPLITEAILPTRPMSKFFYTEGVLDRRPPQAQQHYLQEIVYSHQPGALTYVPTLSSSHEHAASYDRPSSVHLDTNTLGQNYASQTRQEQTYTPYEHQSVAKYATINSLSYSPRLTNQIYQKSEQQTAFDNIPETPGGELDLPRLPAQNFKSSGPPGPSHKSANDHENSQHAQTQLVHTSEPRSLLESYIPSNVLAAQNAERYRERPIRLESGFLPSKVNYVRPYKKHETV